MAPAARPAPPKPPPKPKPAIDTSLARKIGARLLLDGRRAKVDKLLTPTAIRVRFSDGGSRESLSLPDLPRLITSGRLTRIRPPKAIDVD